MLQRFFRIIILATSGWLLAGHVGAQTAGEQPAPTAEVVPTPIVLSALQQAIKAELGRLAGKSKAQKIRNGEIRNWYEERVFAPLWIKDGRVSTNAEEVIFKLMTAYEDGLVSREYNGSKLFAMAYAQTPEEQARFEVMLSDAAVKFGQHLHSGRVRPNGINRELVIYPKSLAANQLLDRLVDAKSSAAELGSLWPQTARYVRLRKHLLALRVLEARGGWPQIPSGDVLKPDMEDARVATLRDRLIRSRDLKRGAHEGAVYNGELVDAVKRFQNRLGLEQDGAVGPTTLGELNKTVKQRIALVELNLERRRWMQADFGNPYVFVNLADQVLKLVKDNRTLHAELTQVGQPYHRTPVFSDEMEYMEVNPYWNVPYSIATKEYLPKLKRNPFALQSQNIKVLKGGSPINPGAVPWSSYSRAKFPVRLRQEPGKKNALGRIKFMFPNKFNVYIHDTPSKSKFARTSRYFSHGCVRLRNPFDLAAKILAADGQSPNKLKGVVKSGKRTIIKLKKKIPVHVTYLTAWVNKDGSVHYRRDIYGRDKILAEALGL